MEQTETQVIQGDIYTQAGNKQQTVVQNPGLVTLQQTRVSGVAFRHDKKSEYIQTTVNKLVYCDIEDSHIIEMIPVLGKPKARLVKKDELACARLDSMPSFCLWTGFKLNRQRFEAGTEMFTNTCLPFPFPAPLPPFLSGFVAAVVPPLQQWPWLIKNRISGP